MTSSMDARRDQFIRESGGTLLMGVYNQPPAQLESRLDLGHFGRTHPMRAFQLAETRLCQAAQAAKLRYEAHRQVDRADALDHDHLGQPQNLSTTTKLATAKRQAA